MIPDRIARVTASRPDPRLWQALAGLLFLGVVVLASLPAARGYSAQLGWMPLWLLGLPLVALAALGVSGAWPVAAQPPAMAASRRRRGSEGVQARRREPLAGRARMPRAA